MLRTVHTAEIEPAVLEASRSMVFEAFDGRFNEIDWRHSLGGLHVLALGDDGEIEGHAALVARSFRQGDRQLRCGYVEGVAVRTDRRRRGIGDAVMERVGELIGRGYEIGALSATNEGAKLYARHGWAAWPDDRLGAVDADGFRRCPSDEGGWVWVLDRGEVLDPNELLVCDWRDGDLW